MHFINHIGKQGIGFLHSGGKASTDFIIEKLIEKNCKTVLEIGCGTGTTLISLAVNKINNITGIDISASQIEVAKKRIEFCGLENLINIQSIKSGEPYHFEDESFDAVIAESVLGILPHKNLENILNEVKRILKPGGILITNDAIWETKTPLATIQKINSNTMRDFGLLQSSEQLVGEMQWKQRFEAIGFRDCEFHDIKKINTNKALTELELKSNTFSKQQKRYYSFNLKFQLQNISYKIKEYFLHKKTPNHLSHFIFIMHT